MPVLYPIALSFFLGIMAGYFAGVSVLFPAVASAAIVFACFILRSKDRVYIALVICCVFFTSWLLYDIDELVYFNSPVMTYLEKREEPHRLEAMRATVESVRKGEDGASLLILKSEAVRMGEGEWMRVGGTIAARYPAEAERHPAYGERWLFEGWLKPVSEMKKGKIGYYRQNRIHARLIVANKGNSRCEGKGLKGFSALGGSLRAGFERTLGKRVAGPFNQIAGRMLIGKAQYMDPELYERFRRAGLVHVLVVSGMHVWIMLGTFFLLSFIWGRRPLISFVTLSFVLIVYYGITGGGSSIFRATIMGFVFLAALLFGSEYKAKKAIFIAAIMVMIINPMMIFNVGAQMTFLASAGVIFIYPAFSALFPSKGLWHRVLKGFFIALSAQLPLYPVIAYYFNQISLVAPVSNLFVVPLVGIILPLDLLTCIVGFIPGEMVMAPAFVLEWLIRLMVWLTDIFAGLPMSNIDSASPSMWWMAVYGGGLFLLVWTLRKIAGGTDSQIVTGVLLLLLTGGLLLAAPFLVIPLKGIKVTFLDVGEGDAILLEMPLKKKGYGVFRMLVDGGGSWGATENYYDPGKSVTGKYLKKRGIKRLDAVLLTHTDADHMNGLEWVVNNIKTDRFMDAAVMSEVVCEITSNADLCAAERGVLPQMEPGQLDRYKRIIERVAGNGTEYIPVSAGDVFRLESGVEMFIMSPDGAMLEGDVDSMNMASVVLKVKIGEGAVLLTGDIQNETETRLARIQGDALEAGLLKVPHHGSGTSSSYGFIEKVDPAAAVITTGGESFYGHPHRSVVERYKKSGVKIYRTDKHGDVSCMVSATGDVKCRYSKQY